MVVILTLKGGSFRMPKVGLFRVIFVIERNCYVVESRFLFT